MPAEPLRSAEKHYRFIQKINRPQAATMPVRRYRPIRNWPVLCRFRRGRTRVSCHLELCLLSNWRAHCPPLKSTPETLSLRPSLLPLALMESHSSTAEPQSPDALNLPNLRSTKPEL